MEGRASDSARLTAVVRGFVQGVGYRDYASRQASRRGLRGYVRNSSDGSVEIQAEGGRADLEGFLEDLRRGPALAEVDSVDASWEAGRGEFQRWELRW
jgi:acylphosphatase